MKLLYRFFWSIVNEDPETKNIFYELENNDLILKYAINRRLEGITLDFFNAQKATFTISTIGKDEVLKQSDFITLHLPSQEGYIISSKEIDKMKDNVGIINAARGGIVNEIDLDKALKEDLIFGAGLDVFEIEPPEPNNPLLKNDKVFLSPHTAAFTEECMTRMGKETIQNIIDFFDEKLEKSKTVKL